MFNFLKKKEKITGEKITIKITGMHCTSCSMSVDGDMEELDGVISSNTSYAKQKTVIEYDDTKVGEKEFRKVITDLGYKVK